MDRRISLPLFAALTFAEGLAAQEVQVLAFDRLRDVRMTSAASATAELAPGFETPVPRSSAAAGALALGFDAFGARFALALEPNAPINDAARRIVAGSDAVAYKGTLRDRPESWARIVVTAAGLAGLVWDGRTLYGIEPPGDTLTGADATTIFRLDDVYVPPGTLSCGVGGAATMTGAQMLAALVGELETAAAAATLNLDIGAVADVEFSQARADPSAAVLTRMNNVDGIFSDQVGVQITVQAIDVFAAEPDPFEATDGEALLDELAMYRGATPTQDALGLTHLFTGRNLDGSTVGIAFLGALCARRSRFDSLERSFGVGLTSSINNVGPLGVTLESLVAAHEIGHNFGAPHDGQDACAATPDDQFLMAPSLNSLSPNRDQFSDCSLEQMQIQLDAASCLTPIDFVDVALTANPPANQPLAGVAFDYTITATNLGAAEAASVAVDLAFAPAFEIVALTPAAGSCSTQQNDASCDLGALPGGTSRGITASLRTAATGDHAITGTVTAPDDVAIANDDFSATVSILPTVDLAVSAAALRIERNRSGSLAVSLRNLAGTAAQSVALAVQASAGLRIDSATIEGQACTVSANAATCSTPTLAGLASASIALGLTGITSGAQTLNLSVSALEADSNAADNALAASIDVFDAPAQESAGGGGGAIGPWAWLALLGAAALRRRRLVRV